MFLPQPFVDILTLYLQRQNLLIKPLSHIRQLQPAIIVFKQLEVVGLFQVADMLLNGGLAHMQLLGCFRVIQRFAEKQKGL